MNILYRRMILFVSVILLLPFYVHAQFTTEGVQFGVQFNGLYPANDFSKEDLTGSYELSYLGRAFFRFEIIEGLQAELGGGYGIYAGKDLLDVKYETEIYPVDFRFVVSPFKSDSWNPYFYVGAGALRYLVKQKPRSLGRYSVEDNDWVAYYPVGIGAQFRLSDNLMFETNLGVGYSLSENLEYYSKPNSANDAYINLGIGFTLGPQANDDKDLDGIFRKEEEQLGTDPLNPDSDADGLNDGEEVNSYKTDPLSPDSDSDGLNDGVEITQYQTNPVNSDTDGDGLNDGDEVSKYKTDPNKADSDSDGLNDDAETMTHKTDPNNADSDSDGLNDGAEVNVYKTDPTKADSDGDGLNDGDEVNNHKTDPLNPDSDSGTVDDGIEIRRGTNPLDPEDDVVKVGVPIILEGITFATGKAEITSESEETLQKALRTLQTYPEIDVEIGGHTDNVGSKSSNQRLSQRRAESVRDWLIENGIDANRLTAVGYGEDQPTVDNDTPENKAKNRRIEFKRIK
jgi:outer membrane protein OmpA-like peptidoglycan-associated protein